MRRWIWILVVVGSVAGATALLWWSDGGAPRPPAPVAGSSLAPARSAAPVADVRPRRVAATPTESEADAAPAERTASEEAADTTSERVPTVAEVRDRMEASFYASTADPGPARELERTLERELPGRLPGGSVLRGLDCRAGICRIETAHASIDAYEQFVGNAFDVRRDPLIAGGAFVTPLAPPVAGQPLRIVAYVATPGVGMPGQPAPAAPPAR